MSWQRFSKQKTITKKHLCRTIHDNLRIKLQDTQQYLNATLNLLCCALLENKPIKLQNFGSFSVYHKRLRIGRNPKTGDVVEIQARKVVRFKVSSTLRKKINSNIQK